MRMGTRRHATIVIIGVALALAGCAIAPSREVLSVHDADSTMVSDCTFVGDVTGTSAALALGSANRIQSAKDDARTQAAKLGACTLARSLPTATPIVAHARRSESYPARMRVQRLSTAQHRGILVTWRNGPRPARAAWPSLSALLGRVLVIGAISLAIHYVTPLLAGLF